MSWFERRRHRAVEALRGEAPVVFEAPVGLELSHAADREVEDMTDVAVEPTEPGDVLGSGAMPKVTGRAGRYVVTDDTGAQVGTILGDYVIGFTVDCWSVKRTFSDMESAMAAIAVESQARTAAGLLKAS